MHYMSIAKLLTKYPVCSLYQTIEFHNAEQSSTPLPPRFKKLFEIQTSYSTVLARVYISDHDYQYDQSDCKFTVGILMFAH